MWNNLPRVEYFGPSHLCAGRIEAEILVICLNSDSDPVCVSVTILRTLQKPKHAMLRGAFRMLPPSPSPPKTLKGISNVNNALARSSLRTRNQPQQQ